MPDRKNVAFQLDDEQHAKLVAIAARDERSLGYLAHSKHRREDRIDLHADLVPLLLRFVRGLGAGQPLFPNLKTRKTWKMMRVDLAAAGVPYSVGGRVRDFHALRHTFITRAWDTGAKPDAVPRLARHGSLAMTMQYTHTDQEELVAAVRAMPGLPKPR